MRTEFQSLSLLPGFARPVASLGLRAGVGAVMTGTETLAASRIRLLDRHVRVTETDNLRLRTGLHVNGGLLRATWRTERLVERDLASFVVCHRRKIWFGSAMKSMSTTVSSSMSSHQATAVTYRPWTCRRTCSQRHGSCRASPFQIAPSWNVRNAPSWSVLCPCSCKP